MPRAPPASGVTRRTPRPDSRDKGVTSTDASAAPRAPATSHTRAPFPSSPVRTWVPSATSTRESCPPPAPGTIPRSTHQHVHTSPREKQNSSCDEKTSGDKATHSPEFFAQTLQRAQRRSLRSPSTSARAPSVYGGRRGPEAFGKEGLGLPAFGGNMSAPLPRRRRGGRHVGARDRRTAGGAAILSPPGSSARGQSVFLEIRASQGKHGAR